MPDPLSDLQRLGQEFDADAVEAVARAIRNAMNCGLTIEGERQFCNSCDCHDAARAAIAAARPMIEAEALERAAGVGGDAAKNAVLSFGSIGPTNRIGASTCAQDETEHAIRSLIEPRP